MENIFPTRQVISVDSQDNVLGSVDIYLAHEYPMIRHRAVSVWLINSKKEILFQKRSQMKPIGAGWWGNAICGNVKPGESCEECAVRRLREEVGIIAKSKIQNPKLKSNQELNVRRLEGGPPERSDEHWGMVQAEVSLTTLYKFEYRSYGNETYGEHEIDTVYAGQYDGEVTPNPDEAEKAIWIPQDFIQAVLDKIDYINPEDTLTLTKEQLKAKTPVLKIVYRGQTLEITPWTMMMLKDERLSKVLFA